MIGTRVPHKDTQIVIVGAGLGGAAAAYALACYGYSRITLLEKEDCAGYYASGRNAAMLRHLDDDPLLRFLVRRGASRWYRPESGSSRSQVVPPHFPGGIDLIQMGSWLVAEGEMCSHLAQWADDSATDGLHVKVVSGGEDVCDAIPVLGKGCSQLAVFTGADGVVDVEALLQGFLAGARVCGAKVQFGVEVTGVRLEGGRVTGVVTGDGDELQCDLLINGAGAWAGELGKMAGALALDWRLFKRHIAHMQPPMAETEPELSSAGSSNLVIPSSIIWHLSKGIYARPEANGVLMCPCDEMPTPPCDPQTDFSALELLAEKAAEVMPGLAEAELIRFWACIRTFSPDGRIVIGPDSRVGGFFWVAGLGGSGVSIAPSLPNLILQAMGISAEEADSCLLPLGIPADVVEKVSPKRFA